MKSVNASIIIVSIIMMISVPMLADYARTAYNGPDFETEEMALLFVYYIAGSIFFLSLINSILAGGNFYSDYLRDKKDPAYSKYTKLRNQYETWSNPWEFKRPFEEEIEEYFVKKFGPKKERKKPTKSPHLGAMKTEPSVKNCPGCGVPIQGSFCTECGMKVK